MTQDSRLVFAAKGVGAFFVFLVPFLAASSYFGGGLVGIGVSIVLALFVAGGLVIVWPRFHQAKSDFAEKDTGTDAGNRACKSGPYRIYSGTPKKIELKVKAGDRVEGYIEEVNGDFFDWYIVDEANMVECLNREEYDYVEGEENVIASRVDCTIPEEGPWYLMLDLGTRRYDRMVKVNLRVNRNC
jgi:hypothetical protein